MNQRALTALRRAAAGTGTVTVRREHLRALIEAYDRAVLRREPAEPMRIEEDCEPMAETLARVHCLTCNADCGWAGVNREPSLSGECADYEPQETEPAVESDATGAGWRREG